MRRRHVILVAAASVAVLGLLFLTRPRAVGRASHPPAAALVAEAPASEPQQPEATPQEAALEEAAPRVVETPIAEVATAELSKAEREALERHLRRFGPDAGEGPPHWADAVLGSVPRASAKDEQAHARHRRLEQLEALRANELLEVLDAIAAGLAWLVAHQGPDGWFMDSRAARRCVDLGHTPPCVGPVEAEWSPMAATALTVMALAAFRDQDVSGRFEPALARGVACLRSKQAADGRFLAVGNSAPAKLALLALGRMAAATGDAGLRDAVRRGLAHAAKAAEPDGGYRYGHEPFGDLRETAWIALAAAEARNAGIEVPAAMSEGLPRFVTSVWLGAHRFSRERGGTEWAAISPAGMLAGLCVWDDARRADVLHDWRQWVRATPPTRLYPLYHGVRVAIALEPQLPGAWRDTLLALARKQEQGGAAAGAWRDVEQYPLSEIGYAGVGVVPTTAIAVLILEEALRTR